jgi:hypothetical protein
MTTNKPHKHGEVGTQCPMPSTIIFRTSAARLTRLSMTVKGGDRSAKATLLTKNDPPQNTDTMRSSPHSSSSLPMVVDVRMPGSLGVVVHIVYRVDTHAAIRFLRSKFFCHREGFICLRGDLYLAHGFIHTTRTISNNGRIAVGPVRLHELVGQTPRPAWRPVSAPVWERRAQMTLAGPYPRGSTHAQRVCAAIVVTARCRAGCGTRCWYIAVVSGAARLSRPARAAAWACIHQPFAANTRSTVLRRNGAIQTRENDQDNYSFVIERPAFTEVRYSFLAVLLRDEHHCHLFNG